MNYQGQLEITAGWKTLRNQDDLIFDFSTGRVVIITPKDGANFTQGDLYKWGYSGDEERFRVTVATENTFTNIVQQDDVTAVQLASTVSLGSGYYIKIQALKLVPAPPATITGVSISSGEEVERNGSITLVGEVEGLSNYDRDGTWTRVSGSMPFTVSGNEITVDGGALSETSTYRFEASDGTTFSERQITTIEQTSFTPVDSKQGDFDALQALYNSTQGNGIPTLANESELPALGDETYPYMYMISGDIYALERDARGRFTSWTNYGTPWTDKTGWDTMTVDTMGDAVGVTTDANGRVIDIDMQKVTTRPYGGTDAYAGNNLAGLLPVEINNLSKLQNWNIKQNFFHGSIPSISNWSESVRLSFSGQNNNIDVEIRNAWYENNHSYGLNSNGNLQYVKKKVVATNRFRTNLPDTTGFQNIELIEIRHQYLTGTLPAWDNMSTIKGIFIDGVFDAGPDRISGPIPDSWGNLTTVRFLDMYQADRVKLYSGSIPQSILDNWTELNNIKLSNHSFSGLIPEFLNARDKVYVVLDHNEFSGPFPAGYFNGDNSRLSKWSIGFNNLSGSIPEKTQAVDSPIKAPNYPTSKSNYTIDAPTLSNAGLDGDIPDWFLSMPGMQILNAMQNGFTGDPLPVISQQFRLKTLYLNDNEFGGQLPAVTWGERRIGWLFLRGNNYTGEIPSSWISLYQTVDDSGDTVWVDSINFHDFERNNLSGAIPDWVTNFPVLTGYKFDENKYTFADIAPTYSALKAHMGDKFSIKNQKPFGDPQSESVATSGTIPFNMSGEDVTGNTYQWTLNGDPISDGGVFSGATTHTLTITGATSSEAGEYRLEITNNNYPDMGNEAYETNTIVSEPITLTVT